MKLVRLVYFSQSTQTMSLQDIHNILEVARENNQGQGICGMLSYEQQFFLQALEGERSAVNELYLDIADDPRHDSIEILSYEEIEKPVFGDWQMGFAPASERFYNLLNEVGASRFDPASFSPEQALTFLKQLSSHQE
ncbi:MAG: BLUF domain-containing protein [Oceanobacter sp.]